MVGCKYSLKSLIGLMLPPIEGLNLREHKRERELFCTKLTCYPMKKKKGW